HESKRGSYADAGHASSPSHLRQTLSREPRHPVPAQYGGGSGGRCVNRPLKIPTGFHPPAQGWNNPGPRVAVNPQPQGGCVIIGAPHGYNPGGVDDNRSHGPRVARTLQPWAACHNPFGIRPRVAMNPQPQEGCAVIGGPQDHNPGGVDDNESRGPKVTRTAQPWAVYRNPVGIAQTRISALCCKPVGIEQAKIPTG